MRRSGSARTPRRKLMSIINPPSQSAVPATLWPPPRTDNGTPYSRAKFRQATTSALPLTRAIRAGRFAIIAFQIVRASSYPGSAGCSNGPRNSLRSAATADRSNPRSACRVSAYAMAFSDLTAMTKMSTPSPRQAVMHRVAPASPGPVPIGRADVFKPNAQHRAAARIDPDCGRLPPRAWRRRYGRTRSSRASARRLAQLPRAVELDLAGSNCAFQRKIAHEYARHRPQVGRNVETHLESRVGGTKIDLLAVADQPPGTLRRRQIGKIELHAGPAGRERGDLDAAAHGPHQQGDVELSAHVPGAEPALAPFAQLADDRREFSPRLGEVILRPLRPVLALDHSNLLELFQSQAEQAARHQ